MECEEQKEVIVIFKSFGELMQKLMETVQPLNEDGRYVVFIFRNSVSTSQSELVTKGNPLLLYQNYKPHDSSVIGVDYDLGKRS